MVTVCITDAEVFFATHHAEQERLKQEAPTKSMEQRLRPYFPISFGGEPVIFSINLDGDVVAIAECLRAEEGADPHVLGLSYVSVDPNYRRQGLAKAIVECIGSYACENGYIAIDSSHYTDDGDAYLKPILRRLSGAIQIRECGKIYRPSPNASL